MRIDSLSAEHIDVLLSIENECFGKSAWSREGFLAELTNPNGVFLCAVEEGKVLGCAAMNNACGQGFISKIMVKTTCRHQGVGTALLQALTQAAREKRMFELTLEVRQSNEAAIALYRKCGFKTIGTRRKFYHDPEEDAVIMTKAL